MPLLQAIEGQLVPEQVQKELLPARFVAQPTDPDLLSLAFRLIHCTGYSLQSTSSKALASGSGSLFTI
jgi:hypothetical protein